MSKAKQVAWNGAIDTPIVLVSGPEDYLASRAIRGFREQLKSVDPLIEVSTIDASTYAAGQLIELTTPSLFDEPRFVIIENVERCTDALIEDGLAFLASPGEGSSVLFRHSSGVRGKKLLDALKANALVTVVACDKISKDQERMDFAAGEFKAANKKVTNAALRAIVEAFSEDIAELGSACQQLIQDTADGIDEKVVDKYYGGRIETSSFKVADAAVAGDAGTALALLRHLVTSGQDPVAIIGGIALKTRNMAKLYQNRQVTAAQLGVAPWVLDKTRRDLTGWSDEGLANVILEMAVADAAAKGAEKDSVFALERLVLLIAHKGLIVERR